MVNIKNIFKVTYIILTGFVTIYGQDIAIEKCKEYAKAVYVKKYNPVISLRSAIFAEESQCAIVEVKLIIGGKKANEKEFPHMALIGFGTGKDLTWDCGGTLISERYVLTAAHCMRSQQHGECTMVKLGIIDKEDIEEAQIFDIINRISHPDYKRPARYNDIALVELDKPAKFDGYVRPACLNIEMNLTQKYLIASGFGKTEYSATTGSNELMKVDLAVIDSDVCDGYFTSEKKKTMKQGVVETMLCAGELSGGKDTCQGDSGGPIQTVLQDPYCMYSIVGVTSFGKFCGFANSPAIYSHVAYYIPWIESIVWKEEKH